MIRLLRPIIPAVSTALRRAATSASSNATQGHSSLQIEQLTDASVRAFVQHPYPVVLDCFADWCEPCKVLKPRLVTRLEALPSAALLRFGALDADRYPQLAAALRVETLPSVFALHQARVFAHFTGNVPDTDLDAFVQTVASHPSLQSAQSEAADNNSNRGDESQGAEKTETVQDIFNKGEKALVSSSFQEALQHYQTVLQSGDSALEVRALCGTLRTLLGLRDQENAVKTAEVLKSKHAKETSTATVASSLRLLDLVQMDIVPLDRVRPRRVIDEGLQNAPNDPALLYESILDHMFSSKHEAAVDDVVRLIRFNRGWKDNAPRKIAQATLEAVPPQTKSIVSLRKKVSSVLFV